KGRGGKASFHKVQPYRSLWGANYYVYNVFLEKLDRSMPHISPLQKLRIIALFRFRSGVVILPLCNRVMLSTRLAIALVSLVAFVPVHAGNIWTPGKTYAVVASITEWPKQSGLSPFTDQRRDEDLVAQLKKDGIPGPNIT